jgi:hypothetical protein
VGQKGIHLFAPHLPRMAELATLWRAEWRACSTSRYRRIRPAGRAGPSLQDSLRNQRPAAAA